MDTNKQNAQAAKATKAAAPYPTDEKGNKIVIFYDIEKDTKINLQLGRVIDNFAKTVIPAMTKLGIKAKNIDELLSFTNKEKLAQAYADRQEEEAAAEMGLQKLPKTLSKMTRKLATSEAQATILQIEVDNNHRWATMPNEAKNLLEYDPETGALGWSPQAVKESCTRYLTNEEKPAYDFLQQEAKRLNDFFKGRIENPLGKCFFTIPGDKKNTIFVNMGAPFYRLHEPADTTATKSGKAE